MTESLTIERIGHRGDGIATTPAGDVFVPYALTGECVETASEDGHPDRRRLLRVATESSERTTSICPHFGTCGGCATQHWQLAPYLAWKRQLVIDALRLEGIDTTDAASMAHDAPSADACIGAAGKLRVDACIDAHGDGRRRVTLHARRGAVGFMAARAHQLVEITQCPVLAPAMIGALPAAQAIAQALRSGKPLDIQITATETGLDVDIRGSGRLSAADTGTLARIASDHRLVRLTRHGELVAQTGSPRLRIGSAIVTPPPGVFLQATQAGETTLATLVAGNVGKAKRVADLFCGIGTFALRLAQRAPILAADSEGGAIDALKKAAAGARGLKPIETQARDLFRRPMQPLDLKGVDAVVFDPPRQGAEAQAKVLAASNVPVVVAVSCNPATFARDLRILIDGGYRLTRVTPVDQFRYSPHVEVVGRLERR
jgi:23S rRNA (uracil1939-C5)-methyltransferase